MSDQVKKEPEGDEPDTDDPIESVFPIAGS